VVIVTGDRDMWQLVNETISVYLPGTAARPSKRVNRAAVKALLGVWPEQVPDYKGLAGDGSDNIPGVTGIGPKTAVTLIDQFGSIEAMYAKLETAELPTKLYEKLVRDKEQAIQSKHLATIVTDVPIELDWEHCRLTAYDKDEAVEGLLKYEFRSLIPLLPEDTFETSVQEALL